MNISTPEIAKKDPIATKCKKLFEQCCECVVSILHPQKIVSKMTSWQEIKHIESSAQLVTSDGVFSHAHELASGDVEIFYMYSVRRHSHTHSPYPTHSYEAITKQISYTCRPDKEGNWSCIDKKIIS